MANKSRRSGRAPNVHWTGIQGFTAALSAGSVGVLLSSSQHATETLLRLRGNLTAWIDGAQAGGQSVIASIGIHLVPEGTGITVTVDPFGDPSRSWWYYSTFVLGYEEYVTDAVDAAGLSVFREIVDVKAMRIVRPDTELQMVITNTTLVSAASINVSLDARALSQE